MTLYKVSQFGGNKFYTSDKKKIAKYKMLQEKAIHYPITIKKVKE